MQAPPHAGCVEGYGAEELAHIQVQSIFLTGPQVNMYVRGLRDGTAEDALSGFKARAAHMHRLLHVFEWLHLHLSCPVFCQSCVSSAPVKIDAWPARCLQQTGTGRDYGRS